MPADIPHTATLCAYPAEATDPGILPRNIPMSDTTFRTLGVPTPLLEVLAKDGKTSPFPIQVDTLPDTLAGRDVLGRGRTGSGKTLAFALPLVARLARLVPSGSGIPARTRPGAPRGLVLAPTRELANQILATIEPLARAAGLPAMTIFGCSFLAISRTAS